MAHFFSFIHRRFFWYISCFVAVEYFPMMEETARSGSESEPPQPQVLSADLNDPPRCIVSPSWSDGHLGQADEVSLAPRTMDELLFDDFDNGDFSALSSGDFSALSSGDFSALSSGDFSALSSGDFSALSSDNFSALSTDDFSALSSGFVEESTVMSATESFSAVSAEAAPSFSRIWPFDEWEKATVAVSLQSAVWDEVMMDIPPPTATTLDNLLRDSLGKRLTSHSVFPPADLNERS